MEKVCLLVFEERKKKSHVAVRGTLLTIVGSRGLARRLGGTVGGIGTVRKRTADTSGGKMGQSVGQRWLRLSG
jgi:hypothetical protein